MSEFAGWQAVLSRVRERRPAVADVFAHARVLAFGAERVDIGFPITSDVINAAAASSSTLREALCEHFGCPVRVGIERLLLASPEQAVDVASECARSGGVRPEGGATEADQAPGGLDLRLTFGDLLLKFEGELGPESRADRDLAPLYQQATQSLTNASYRSCWREFARWCLQRGLVGMPAAPAVLRLHLVHLAAKGRSVSVIKVARAAVCQAHAVLGYPPPAAGPLQAALRSVLRKVGDVQPRRPPLRMEHLRALVLTCKDDAVGARDKAVLLVTHHARMRRAEITQLDLKDVFFDDAGLVFRVGADILGAAAQPVGVLCPVRALEKWLPIRARCAHDTGPLFVTMPRAGEAFGTRMTCKDVYRMVRRRAELAGLENLNLACERDQRRRVCAL